MEENKIKKTNRYRREEKSNSKNDNKRNINKDNMNKKKSVLILSCVAIIILLIILIPKIISNSKNNRELLGRWTIDGYTDYEFSEDKKGKLIVPNKEYPFTYKVEDNKLYIDFENENSSDSTYEYSFEDGKMFWKGTDTTTGEFIFAKKE